MLLRSAFDFTGIASALLNPEMSISLQKRHWYTGNVTSEMPMDCNNASLHWGYV